MKRFDRQAAGQLFDLAVPQSGGIRSAVMDADGFDFVFVVFDELPETGDQCFGSFLGFGIETGSQQLVAGELVDHLMLGTQQDFAELRVVKRQQGGFDLLGFDFVKLGVGDDPSAFGELSVDVYSRSFFRRHSLGFLWRYIYGNIKDIAWDDSPLMGGLQDQLGDEEALWSLLT